MKLLLDANAFIWAYARPPELSATARRALADAANDRFISIVSLWEIAIKMSIGKLSLIDDFSRAIEDLALSLYRSRRHMSVASKFFPSTIAIRSTG